MTAPWFGWLVASGLCLFDGGSVEGPSSAVGLPRPWSRSGAGLAVYLLRSDLILSGSPGGWDAFVVLGTMSGGGLEVV